MWSNDRNWSQETLIKFWPITSRTPCTSWKLENNCFISSETTINSNKNELHFKFNHSLKSYTLSACRREPFNLLVYFNSAMLFLHAMYWLAKRAVVRRTKTNGCKAVFSTSFLIYTSNYCILAVTKFHWYNVQGVSFS